jgi:hypothetical protein
MPSVARLIVTNRSGLPASDLHVSFTGSGGDLGVDPGSVKADGCPQPRIPSNEKAATNEVDIEWPTPCVAPDGTVRFQAASSHGPLKFASGYWTLRVPLLGDIWIGDVSADDVVIASAERVPSQSPRPVLAEDPDGWLSFVRGAINDGIRSAADGSGVPGGLPAPIDDQGSDDEDEDTDDEGDLVELLAEFLAGFDDEALGALFGPDVALWLPPDDKSKKPDPGPKYKAWQERYKKEIAKELRKRGFAADEVDKIIREFLEALLGYSKGSNKGSGGMLKFIMKNLKRLKDMYDAINEARKTVGDPPPYLE